MKYVMSGMAAILGLAVLVGGMDAGSVDGRQRWTHKNTSIVQGRVKANQPIYVRANGQTELRITFKANEFAEFMVIGDGDCDIDLYIYDANNNLVKSDVDPAERGSDLCLCEWTPPQTQEYRIVLKNLSNVDSICQAGCN